MGRGAAHGGLENEGVYDREYLVCGQGIYTFSRAVYEDDWIYARIYHPDAFSVPGLYNDPELLNDGLGSLHDLDAVLHMTENLIVERPEVVASMRGRLKEWTAEHVGTEEAAGGIR